MTIQRHRRIFGRRPGIARGESGGWEGVQMEIDRGGTRKECMVEDRRGLGEKDVIGSSCLREREWPRVCERLYTVSSITNWR